MKKKVLLLCALIASITTAWAGTKTVYLDPDMWNDGVDGDGNPVTEVYAIFAWGGFGSATYNEPSTVVKHGKTCYQFEIPGNTNGMLFLRGDATKGDGKASWDNYYNQTVDVTNIVDGCVYKITSWSDGADGKSTCDQYYDYTIYFATNKGWNPPHIFTYEGGAYETATREWPGDTMTGTGESVTATDANTYSIYSYSILAKQGTVVMFNDGVGGSGDLDKEVNMGSLVNGKIYLHGITASIPAIPAVTSDAHLYQIYPSVGFNWYDWGGGASEDVTIGGNTARRIYNFRWFGSQFSDVDAWDYEILHLDIYPEFTGTLAIVPINVGEPEKGVQFNVTANEWNSLELNVADLVSRGLTMERFYIVKYVSTVNSENAKGDSDGFGNGDGTQSFIVGNVYLYGTRTISISNLSLSASLTEGLVGATATLSVTDQDDNHVAASALNISSSNESVATVSGNVVTFAGAGTATITAALKTDGEVKATVDVTVTALPATAPAAPTGDVYVVYDGTTDTWSDQGWGWGSIQSDQTLGGKACRMGTNLGSMQIPNPDAMKTGWGEYTQLKVDVWSAYEHSLDVYFEGSGVTKKVYLSPGWNELVVPVEGVTASNVNYLTFHYDEFVKNGVLIFSNIYYAKGEVVIPFHITSTGIVTGNVAAANATAINASTAAVIDLTGATITEDITLNPANQNAVIKVNGTGTTPDTNGKTLTAPNIVVKTDANNCAATADIALVDDNASQPAYNFVINFSGGTGFTYKRTIGADKWVSYFSPATVTIPDGVDVYKATDATTTSITFTKQDNKNLGANEAVILHNTGADITITSNKADTPLNLTANGGGAAVNGTSIIQYGTARLIETDGTQYALSSGELHPFNGAKIGAFRVYYTGLVAGAPAAAIFIDESDDIVTNIGAIDANGNVTVGEAYNLNGQRVANPTKGLYIVNGKKVVIK